MTSVERFIWIKNGDPLTGEPFTEAEIKAIEAGRVRRELVRQECVAAYSKSPLYMERAAKDPDYWKNFSTGRVKLSA